MSLMSAVVRNVFYPLWTIKDGDGAQLALLNRFDDIDSMTVEQLTARQQVRLRQMLEHAYENCDYYRTVFRECGLSRNSPDPARIGALPLLTKEIIRAKLPSLIARNVPPDRLIHARTGGSTGLPMTFVRDKECIYLRKAQELYFDKWMGYRLGDKAALFVAASHHDSFGDRWKAAVRNATCERMLRFDPHHITDDYMDAFVHEYREFAPSIVKCFPNSLGVFAEFVNRRGVRLPKVRAISCTGENLYAQQRRLFSDTFGGEVFEKFGTRECGVIACECREHRGMHLFLDGAYVEVLDDSGNPAKPGQMGRVVVTDLFNRGMPMIRYEIGDLAVVAENSVCACGSPLPLIERIVGRDRDVLYDGDGNPKPGYLFVEAINSVDLEAQFQVIQTDWTELLVKVVNRSGGNLDLSDLESRFQRIVGPAVKIRFEFTDAIARDPSGKYRYVTSQLPAGGTPKRNRAQAGRASM
jgi:phenylacetate-CoA ligase